jgi:GPI mannosyltransferase 3
MRTSLLSDRKIQWLFLAAIVVQVITCITAVGGYHSDQHFQIIEFSSYQLGLPNAAHQVWELDAMIRPTVQVYLFSGFYLLCKAIGIGDPYAQLMVLRLCTGLALLWLYNALLLHFLRRYDRRLIFYALLILNFSWLFPYMRTLFSSEMISSLFFFGALLWYDRKRERAAGNLLLLAVGTLMAFSCFFRFQMFFAVVGFGIWMFFTTPKHIPFVVVGFLLGVFVNTWLDAQFYHDWVFTPYRYYVENIAHGKAAQFGTSSFLRYIGVIIALVTVPPLSLMLLYRSLKPTIKGFDSPLVLPVLLFIIGHCIVAHKEERFMFPVLQVLPVMIGWGLPAILERWPKAGRGFRFAVWFSIVLNSILLVILLFTPYSQAIHFSKLLRDRFDGQQVSVLAIKQSPFETPSRLQLKFYQKALGNIEVSKLGSVDSLRELQRLPRFISSAFNFTDDAQKKMLDSLGYKPVMFGSPLLWRVNGFLRSRHIHTINDVWVLYERK